MFGCPFCGKNTKNLGFLKLHIRKRHRNNLTCPMCGYETKNLPGLEVHCLINQDEKHKALYYLLHKNATAVNKSASVKELKKYKYLFEVNLK